MKKLWIKYLRARKNWLKSLDLPNEKQIRKLEKVNLSLYRAGAYPIMKLGDDLTDEPYSKEEYLATLAEQRNQMWSQYVDDFPAEATRRYKMAHMEPDRDNHNFVKFDNEFPDKDDFFPSLGTTNEHGEVTGYVAGTKLKPMKFGPRVSMDGSEPDNSLQNRYSEINGIRKQHYRDTSTD